LCFSVSLRLCGLIFLNLDLVSQRYETVHGRACWAAQKNQVRTFLKNHNAFPFLIEIQLLFWWENRYGEMLLSRITANVNEFFLARCSRFAPELI
jgi:hypothetical protein